MGIGFGEMIVVGIIALFVVGPERLPETARGVGKFIKRVRSLSCELARVLSGGDFK